MYHTSSYLVLVTIAARFQFSMATTHRGTNCLSSLSLLWTVYETTNAQLIEVRFLESLRLRRE